MNNIGGRSFSSVKKAKEALRQRADELLNSFIDTIKEAREKGKYEEALKAHQWLLEHIPADEDGGRLFDASIDKPKQITEGNKGPVIQLVGITLGGVKDEQKALPEAVIEAETVDER